MEWGDVVLELNASDERGIGVVRGKIRQFVQHRAILPAHVFKVVILDEADAMTTHAQEGLRRLMDKYGTTTRFALACNSASHISESIQSRCVVLRYRSIADAEMRARLLHIAAQEKVRVDEPGLQALLFTAQGDLRQAINTMQAVANGLGDVTVENVHKIADQPRRAVMVAVVQACDQGNARTACALLQKIWRAGYAPIDILNTLSKAALSAPSLSLHSRIRFAKLIGQAHVRASAGLASPLQLSALLATLASPPTTIGTGAAASSVTAAGGASAGPGAGASGK
jgi:replication factor C subunit 2/4